MSQKHTFITKTHLGCTSCNNAQIVEMFELTIATIPLSSTERVYGPVSLENQREQKSCIDSVFYCEDCGVVYVPTQKNSLAKEHDSREKLAREYFETQV